MEISKLNEVDPNVRLGVGADQVTRLSRSQTRTLEQTYEQSETHNIGAEELQSLTESLNEQMESLGTNVRFSYSEEIGELVVSVTNKDTGEVIRQIPSENAVKMAEFFKNAVGLLFDKEG